MALPGNVGHGTVTGLFVDSAGAFISGKVRFIASPKRLLNVTADPPATILPRPVEVDLNEGAFSQVLIATDDEDNNPHGWTYRVEFLFEGVAADPIEGIEVPENATVDLTTTTPVASSGGTPVVRGPGVPDWSEATNGQVLAIVAGEPTWAAGGSGGGPTALDDLTDVDTDGATDGDVLTYENGEWTPAAAGSSDFSGDYDDLTNKPDLGSLPYRPDDWNPDLSAYATTASLADVATTGSYNDLDDKPSIPAALDPEDFATAEQGELADTAVQPGDLSAYATTSALTSGLAGKANASHTHTIANVTGLQDALDGKASTASVPGHLSDLGDVDTTSASDGDVLIYDDDNETWIPGTPASSASVDAENVVGELALDNLPPGSVIVVDYNSAVYGAANAWPATRPTARTDIVVFWQGPTDPGSIAIAGDNIILSDD